ncbi:hypothetical protein HDU91_005933 [Kappamyces sp. JEL0680]|nr:hypothetical protein HDU91_005933 [Kappamyces sp. JEL0680]
MRNPPQAATSWFTSQVQLGFIIAASVLAVVLFSICIFRSCIKPRSGFRYRLEQQYSSNTIFRPDRPKTVELEPHPAANDSNQSATNVATLHSEPVHPAIFDSSVSMMSDHSSYQRIFDGYGNELGYIEASGKVVYYCDATPYYICSKHESVSLNSMEYTLHQTNHHGPSAQAQPPLTMPRTAHLGTPPESGDKYHTL